MKFEFKIQGDLESLQDNYDMQTLVSAQMYRVSINELDQWLRQQWKYNDSLSEEVIEAYDKARDRLRQICADNNCTEVFD